MESTIRTAPYLSDNLDVNYIENSAHFGHLARYFNVDKLHTDCSDEYKKKYVKKKPNLSYTQLFCG